MVARGVGDAEDGVEDEEEIDVEVHKEEAEHPNSSQEGVGFIPRLLGFLSGSNKSSSAGEDVTGSGVSTVAGTELVLSQQTSGDPVGDQISVDEACHRSSGFSDDLGKSSGFVVTDELKEPEQEYIRPQFPSTTLE